MRATITAAGFSAVILLALELGAAPSRAQMSGQPPARLPPSWPQRTVHVIVPFGAGSATDVTARLFADRLAKRWGQPVVVENRPGADSIVAVGAFAANHDDHTLLYSAPGPITVNPVLYARLPYDPARDLAPISLGSEVFVTIAAPASWAWRLRAAQIEELKCVVVTITGTRPATCFSTASITRSRSASVSTNCSEKLARMQMPLEPASIMKSMQRRWPSRSSSPRSSKMVGATGKTPR